MGRCRVRPAGAEDDDREQLDHLELERPQRHRRVGSLTRDARPAARHPAAYPTELAVGTPSGRPREPDPARRLTERSSRARRDVLRPSHDEVHQVRRHPSKVSGPAPARFTRHGIDRKPLRRAPHVRGRVIAPAGEAGCDVPQLGDCLIRLDLVNGSASCWSASRRWSRRPSSSSAIAASSRAAAPWATAGRDAAPTWFSARPVPAASDVAA